MAELPDLGDHCSLNACQTLDFLPIRCDLCGFKYCKQHSSYDSHNCIKYKEISVNQSGSTGPIPLHKCLFDGCKNKELISIICEDCKFNFCVLHRLKVDHDCKSNKDSNTENQPKIKKLNEFKFELKTNVSEKNANLAAKLVLMKLRQTADGPPGLPEESKLYCFIKCNNDTKKPFYFSTKWPIGRCVEFLCTKFNVKTQNKAPSLCFETQEIIDTSFIVQELIDKNLFNHGIILTFNT